MVQLRMMGFATCLLALALCNTAAVAQLNVLADYTFDNNMAPPGFSETGSPSYAGGRLILDGSSYLQATSPATAVDDVVLEAIVDATAVGVFNFAASISNADSTNSGYGIVAQNGNWNALTSGIGFPGSAPHGATPTGDAAIAYVRNGGNASLYVNGVPFDSGGGDGAPMFADAGVVTIGGHEFDVPNGLFNGSIDRVRVSTFSPGTFNPSDLLIVKADLNLNIDTATGEVILSTVGALAGNVIGYDLVSSADVAALAPNGWTSIADNYDADSGPTGGLQVDANDNWTKLPTSSTSLAEAELNDPSGDGTQFGAGLAMSLGTIWIPNPFGQDISMDLLFDDGTRQQVTVLYDGEPVNPVVLGDFSGNGLVDEADWPTVRDNFDVDVAALTPAAGYNLGDMNRDGTVDVLDFGEFKTAFIAEQGAAAFAAMVAGFQVPEPSTMFLLAAGGFVLVGRHRRFRRIVSVARSRSVRHDGGLWMAAAILGALIAASNGYAASTADAIYRLGEDDPGATSGGTSNSTVDLMGGPNLTAEGAGAITYNSNTPNPSGGSTLSTSLNNANNFSGPFVAAGTDTGAGPLFVDNFGIEAWVFANGFEAFDFVVNNGTGGGGIDGEPSTGYGLIQQNGGWHFLHNGIAFRGTSTTAAATGQWVHLAGVVDNGTSRLFVNGVEEGTVAGLPRSPSDSPTTGVMTIGSNPFDVPNGMLDGLVDHVRLFSFETGDFEPDRDLSFNALITGDVLPALLTLEITNGSGNATIANTSGETLSLDYYAIASSTNVANPNWTGIAPAGDGTGNGWEKLGTPSSSLIQQAYLAGATELLDGTSTNSLGSVYTGSGQADEEGISFTYRSPDGVLRTGLVTFVEGGVPGDYNDSGAVEQGDLDLVLLNWGEPWPPEIPGWVNDQPTDGKIDQDDLDGVLLKWGNTSATPSAQAVPEPSAAILTSLLLGAVAWLRLGKRGVGSIAAVALLAVVLVTADTASADVTLERDYRLGDDSLESGSIGAIVGSNNLSPASNGFTLDSSGPSGAYLDLSVNGAPKYADTSGRLGATPTEQGAMFDGVDDYLSTAKSLNAPSLMWNDGAFFPAQDYPFNYDGLFARGIQTWVEPNSAKQGVQQDIVIDTPQHGIVITESNTWGLLYSGGTTDSGSAVDFDAWTHVMAASTGGASVLYVNGVALSVDVGFYNADTSPLSIAANQDGSDNFFQGRLDDVKLFLWGDNSDTTATNNNPDAVGMDHGDLNLGEDNDFIVAHLASLEVTHPADVNLDGSVNQADIDAFLPTWKSQRLVDGVQVGDWISRQNGDLDYNGLVDLDDVFILHDGLLLGGGAGFPFELLSTLWVPEPASATLIVTLMFLWLGLGRCRHREVLH